MRHGVQVRKAAEVTGSSASLPADLLRAARRRLGIASLVLAGLFLFGVVFQRTLFPVLFDAEPSVVLKSFAAACCALSVTMFVLTGNRRWDDAGILHAGLVYEVVVCLGVSAVEVAEGLVPADSLWRLSWVSVLVVFFPALVPTPPVKALATALAAASTGPLVYAFAAWEAPPLIAADLVRTYLPNYIAATLAVAPAFVIYRLGRDVNEVRELGSYRLVELLGRGGMGEAWRARHRMLARPAAVKLIRSDALQTGTADARQILLRRFEQEAQATATLQSPHSVELYDFGVAEDGTLYYVMELLEGLDLRHLLERFGPLPPGRVIHLLTQVCDSLEDAHHIGLIHHDVKPGNLFVCRKRLRADFVKVLDFGLARSVRGGHAAGVEIGLVSGTPAYMAPETALGKTEDARTDLYALGCVAYELLTGQLVFRGSDAAEILRGHVETLPLPPSAVSEEEIPESLDRVVLACLEKDPGRRPHSAAEVVELLAACRVEPPWTAQRADAWWRTHLPRVGEVTL